MKYFVKVLNCLCLNFHTSQKRLVRRLVSHQSRQFEYISSTAMNTAQAIGVDDIINEQRVLNTHPKITKESTRRELQVLGILDEDE